VEIELFPALRQKQLYLRSIDIREHVVDGFIERVMKIFRKNIVGPKLYLDVYREYETLINRSADNAVDLYITQKHSLDGYRTVRPSTMSSLIHASPSNTVSINMVYHHHCVSVLSVRQLGVVV